MLGVKVMALKVMAFPKAWRRACAQWFDTPMVGMAEPCRGAFPRLRLMPPT
jgi:hypothetical protein